MRYLGLAVFAASLAATQASAATATFDFDASSNGSWVDELNYSDSGVDLSVTHENGGDVQTWAGHGLGARDGDGISHQVDSYGADDGLLFSFSMDGDPLAVKVTEITFNYVHEWDDFELFEDGSSLGVFDVVPTVNPVTGYADSFSIEAVGGGDYYSDPYLGRYLNNEVCSFFGFVRGYGHKYHCKSAFKITGMTVEYREVTPAPLPAAGWLLLGGLAGLGVMRRLRP